jgi:hypothetical protein
MSFKKISFLLLLILMPLTNYAWGEKGHTLVAEVAFKKLDKKTRIKILTYLDFKSLKDAANWMDDIKKDKSLDSLKPWHYVNFEIEQAVTLNCCDNIIYRLDKTIAELKNYQNYSKEEVKTKLLYLFHLIGDLHQPLHVGYGSDKGGNDFQVQFNGKGTNLHSLFDSKIIEFKNLTLKNVLKQNRYSRSEIKAIQSGDILSWSIESRSYLDAIYTVPDRTLDAVYIDKNYELIKTQIQIAGLRLAGILESCFK